MLKVYDWLGEERTFLMIAFKHGSIGVLKRLFRMPGLDVNFCEVCDKFTTLHCTASNESANAYSATKLLLYFKPNRSSIDALGRKPIDMVRSHPMHTSSSIMGLLIDNTDTWTSLAAELLNKSVRNAPVDISMPDEFWMYEFKILPCNIDHDWNKCPFCHIGENNNVRRMPYGSSVCASYNLNEGKCIYGNMCRDSNGPLESYLHLNTYRSRLLWPWKELQKCIHGFLS